MTRQCAWCKKSLGEKAPMEDERITHGICLGCRQKLLRDAGVCDTSELAPTRELEVSGAVSS
jgi:hypothetical protein